MFSLPFRRVHEKGELTFVLTEFVVLLTNPHSTKDRDLSFSLSHWFIFKIVIL